MVPAPGGRKNKMFGKEQREKIPSYGARGTTFLIIFSTCEDKKPQRALKCMLLLSSIATIYSRLSYGRKKTVWSCMHFIQLWFPNWNLLCFLLIPSCPFHTYVCSTHPLPSYRHMRICPGTTVTTMWSCQSCCIVLDLHFPLGSEKSFRRSAALSSPVSSSSSVYRSTKARREHRQDSSCP